MKSNGRELFLQLYISLHGDNYSKKLFAIILELFLTKFDDEIVCVNLFRLFEIVKG